MACPHGNGSPESCSQCKGAVARRVTLAGGQVLVDGVAKSSTAEHAAAAEEVMLAKPQARVGGRTSTPRRCSICLQPGHNRARCTRG